MRRLLSAVYVALVVVVSVAAAVLVVEHRTAAIADALGYAGPTTRIFIVDFGERGREANDVIDFVDRTGSALAYTPSSDGGLLTLYDPHGLFQGSDGPLYEPLAEAGDAPAALVSDSLRMSAADVEVVLPQGTRIVGEVDPDVGLNQTAPVVIRNLAAGPLGGGTYVIAGAVDVEELLDTLVADGSWIGDATAYGPAPVAPYDGIYGAVLVGLLGVFALMGTLVIVLDVAQDRDRLRVGAVLGADRRDLQQMVWARAAPRLAGGTGAGMLIAVAGSAMILWRLMTDQGVIAGTVAATVTGVVAWWAATLGSAAWWQAWRRTRAVPR